MSARPNHVLRRLVHLGVRVVVKVAALLRRGRHYQGPSNNAHHATLDAANDVDISLKKRGYRMW
jgi:hypothetical protein